jgi:hypothetical protein
VELVLADEVLRKGSEAIDHLEGEWQKSSARKPINPGAASFRYGGRLQIGMVGAINSLRRATSDRYAWATSSESAFARHLGLRDHTTALYAVSRMQPLMAALEPELGEEDTVQRWVECALPLLFLHIAEIRAKNRAHGVAMHGPSGKFARQDWTTTSPPEP